MRVGGYLPGSAEALHALNNNRKSSCNFRTVSHYSDQFNMGCSRFHLKGVITSVYIMRPSYFANLIYFIFFLTLMYLCVYNIIVSNQNRSSSGHTSFT